ncbi:exonuclease domain-containing protein [Ferrovibrio xuzhouensis]|uniref:Exonuclease domain-containing protein n=1 Tax=Ferrovibrio xuzhouensis TaxID=1576914 RepID=A0ABV7VEU5_9PROT
MDIIRVLDLETTGFQPPEAEIIEIGWTDVVLRPTGPVVVQEPFSLLVRPERPVPPETSAIHHLVDADLTSGLLLKDAIEIATYPKGARIIAFAAHNAKFERLFLSGLLPADMPWICTWKAALARWPDAPGHGNQVLRYWLDPHGLDRGIAQPAHRAGPDAYATAFTLRELLRAGDTVEDLVRITENPALLPRVPFGHSKGMRWAEVDDGFLYWVLERDFDADVIHTARTELDHRLAERRREAEARAAAEAS